MPDYVRPYLYPKQEAILFAPERISACEASTKAGKTIGCIVWLLEQALLGKAGQNFWWIAPIYPQAEIAFRRIRNALTKGAFQTTNNPLKIDLINGTTIWFKSSDNPDSLYGEDVFAAVIDEASRVKEDAWFAIRSTLTATRGPIRLIGNVKGRKNWFFALCRAIQQGKIPNATYAKLTAFDAVEAGVLVADEIAEAKAILPDHIFRELYMAEPSEDGGNPFGLSHIEACVAPLGNPPAVAFGIDLAKSHDWSVIIGLNTHGEVCVFDRWQHVPWRFSIRRIQAVVGEDALALVDSTGIGDPILEELQFERGNFEGYLFSPAAKQRLMEGLAVSIQSHEIRFPDGPIRQELEVFEYEIRDRGGVRYSAPEGGMFNDDCVCALALAREAWTRTAPGANMQAYMAAEVARARAVAPRSESADVALPRHMRSEIVDAAVVENELTALYTDLLKNMGAFGRPINCAHCGQAVSSSERVTDGELVWHTFCAGGRPREEVIRRMIQEALDG